MADIKREEIREILNSNNDKVFKYMRWDNLDLSHIDFSDSVFEYIDFTKSDITNSNFGNCEFIACNFNEVSLVKSNFKNSNFKNIKFSTENFKENHWMEYNDMNFKNCSFGEERNEISLRCTFKHCEFTECDFELNSFNCEFHYCKLIDIEFRGDSSFSSEMYSNELIKVCFNPGIRFYNWSGHQNSLVVKLEFYGLQNKPMIINDNPCVIFSELKDEVKFGSYCYTKNKNLLKDIENNIIAVGSKINFEYELLNESVRLDDTLAEYYQIVKSSTDYKTEEIKVI